MLNGWWHTRHWSGISAILVASGWSRQRLISETSAGEKEKIGGLISLFVLDSRDGERLCLRCDWFRKWKLEADASPHSVRTHGRSARHACCISRHLLPAASYLAQASIGDRTGGRRGEARDTSERTHLASIVPGWARRPLSPPRSVLCLLDDGRLRPLSACRDARRSCCFSCLVLLSVACLPLRHFN